MDYREFLSRVDISGPLREKEPMSRHTTFETGGPADIYAEPSGAEELAALLTEARRADIPVFILGGGANLLVADRGVRGLVISTRALKDCETLGTGDRFYLRAGAGLPISEAALLAAGAGLAGLEFIYAMPGSAGGALCMNARCYGLCVADILEKVIFLDDNLRVREKSREDAAFMAGFGYKTSPFQTGGGVILEAVFRLRPGVKDEIEEKMRRIEEDRREKGHFLAPSAGSVFKNNRAFGAPAGAILDRLGFRGFTLGGAQVSPLHANIIINTGNAASADIRRLIQIMQEKTLAETGFQLEPEIIYAGDW
ncbi:MAG: UDP-N-acetylmuramate dehydrogenase [Spirochaetales bacterium]|jgi:UDP-N-acetylmuramate dehydrogenase|nr:UDP-N-acetylmuramate dehydrogenase [Spirochaetales bacterium]